MHFYISDLHFGHKNCLEFDHRPFESLEEMEEMIIQNWNRTVSDEDDIWILGDICYRSGKTASWYLKQLRGRKHLIFGNHDWLLKKDPVTLSLLESAEMLQRIEDNGRIVVLCHYPIAVWDQKHRGSYHVYGHVHTRDNADTQFMAAQERAFNAGCMLNGYTPRTLDELEAKHKAEHPNFTNWREEGCP